MARLNNETALDWAIIVDCPVTRRKRFHGVIGPDGTTKFKHRDLVACLEFLRAEGQSRAELLSPELEDSIGVVSFGDEQEN